MGKAISLEEMKERFRIKNPHVTIVEHTFINSVKKCWLTDDEWGSWFAQPCLVLRGNRHPAAKGSRIRRKKQKGVEQFLVRLHSKHGTKFKLVENTYIDMQTHATFVHELHGEWITTPTNILHAMGHPVEKGKHISDAKRMSLELVKQWIQRSHGDVVSIIDETYVNLRKHSTFIDKDHGKWSGITYKVMYGQSHPARRHEKILKTCRNYEPIKHWKTGVDCFPQSGYEQRVLLWLNENHYDFDWQIPFETDVLTNGGKRSTYIMDLFIKSGPHAGQYVEIKGWWSTGGRNIGKEKWEWFHAKYSNSELWMKDELRKLNVLT